MPIRVLDDYGSGWDSDIIQGITWAYEHGADILNLSLGGPGYSQSMQDAINSAHAAGCLIVAAMGNCRDECKIGDETYDNPTSYPAANSNVFAVAATNQADTYAYYSQYGPHCDIAAPGGEPGHDSTTGIYSTMPTGNVYLTTRYSYSNNYDFLQGTSQATPYVSGLAALVWAVHPGFTPDEVQVIIESTAVDLGSPGWDEDYGHGRIDALAAVHEALSYVPVSDLRITQTVTDTTTLTATLSWSAPIDADRIALRYSTAPIDDANWDTAAVVNDNLPGSATTYVATVPYSGGTIYFAVRPHHDGTWVGVSNNAFWPSLDGYLPLVLRQ